FTPNLEFSRIYGSASCFDFSFNFYFSWEETPKLKPLGGPSILKSSFFLLLMLYSKFEELFKFSN
ncbi:MAG: hypothetical protein ACK55Z_25370, partial [bacterium]